ncbi:hypothetical protein PMAYCL1PPCAC_16548, partial [Pristionchus mayeri]
KQRNLSIRFQFSSSTSGIISFSTDALSVKFSMKDGNLVYSPLRKTPTIVVVALTYLAKLANDATLAWMHNRVPRDSPPLRDIFFDIFPEIHGAHAIAECIMVLFSLSALLLICLHRHRWHVIRRVFFCISVAFFFRAFATASFQPPVPSTNTYCAPPFNVSFSSLWQHTIKRFTQPSLEMLQPRVLCGDLIVSGHTLQLFMSLQAFIQYAPKRLQGLKIIFSLLACVAVVAILLSRKHYTIDVVFGYLVATRVFAEYHSLALSYHEGNLYRNPHYSFLWKRVISYLESDAPPPNLFSNQLESPCIRSLKHYYEK